MQYVESSPSPDLRHFIKCFWSLKQSAIEAADSHEPVLPDGRVEIVFNLATRFRRYHSESEFSLQPRTLVAGQMTRNIVIGPSGDVELFGVRFQPVGASYFFGLPMSELTDRIEDYSDLNSTESSTLEDRLLGAHSFERRVSIFEIELRNRLRKVTFDEKFAACVNSVSTIGENVSIPRLASSLGWSERKLERDFKKYVGVSPKTFSRIKRFTSIVKSLESFGPARLVEYAHHYGYYDQSDMINEFRGFAGESPTAFYERSHRLSELFTVGE
jgi:AraC-like DNA-binding protein